MSLINDALKKAQRQRTNNPFGIDPPQPGGGGRVARRSSGMPTQTIVLIAAGCALLIVISGVGAVFFVNGKSTPKPAATVASNSTSTPAAPATPAPDFPKLEIQPIVVPVKTELPVISAAPVPTPTPTVEKKIEPSAAPTPAPVASVKPAAPEPTATPAKTVARGLPDERVHAYLDALRIAGVRASGPTSRVLLNEKVYRLNETVERNLSLKLTAVETDFLKFTDSNGVEYEKTF